MWKSSISLLDHRKIIGASDLDGYARTVVTEGTVGVNVVFVLVEEVAWWRLPCDRRKSSISERKLTISV